MTTNLQKYVAFLTAVEHGSFTKAAEILKYSHSAISRMIQSLEEEWNVVLLERGKKGVQLTSDGIRLLPYIKNICKDYQELQMQVDDLNGLQSGIIRIGTFASVSTHWITKIISMFQKDYPNIDYELLLGDYEEIENWIIEGRVDCGFLRLPTRTELDTYSLKLDELRTILPENHPLASLDTVPFAELENYPFLLLEKDNNTEISDIFAQHGVSPHVRLTTWEDYTIMSLVENNFGISILPNLILQRIPYKIVTKSLEEPVYREIGLAVRNWQTTPLSVKKFVDYLNVFLEI